MLASARPSCYCLHVFVQLHIGREFEAGAHAHARPAAVDELLRLLRRLSGGRRPSRTGRVRLHLRRRHPRQLLVRAHHHLLHARERRAGRLRQRRGSVQAHPQVGALFRFVCSARLPIKVIWEQAASPLLMADLLVASVDNRLTAFARWRRCARPPNTRFLGPTLLTIPNGSSIE